MAATVVTFLLGGWLALTVPLLLFVPRRHVLLPWIAFISVGLAGVVAAANAGALPASGAGTFSAQAQVFAVIAVAALATSAFDPGGRTTI